MGVVYKARDPEIGRLVAIKTLKSVYMGDDPAGEEAMQRFRQESRSAGKLHHPNIVTIFEAGKTESGSPYIVMEYIEGRSLEGMVADDGPLDPLAVIHYLGQIGSSIDYAHSQNVIHRDIKPSNIIVDSCHKPFLVDFGVAKLSDTSLTPAGTVVGTPSYMSPEQIRGATLDGRTDLFSLGVVAFELFTGVRPFPGNDFTTVVSNIMHKPPRSFDELGVELPAELEQVLAKGLDKDREQRYQSSLGFVDALAGVYSVVVDGAGLAGGYRPGQSVTQIASTGDQSVSAGASGGGVSGGSASAGQVVTPISGPLSDSADSSTNGVARGDDDFETMQQTLRSDSPSLEPSVEGAEQRSTSSNGMLKFALGLVALLAIVAGGYLAWPGQLTAPTPPVVSQSTEPIEVQMVEMAGSPEETAPTATQSVSAPELRLPSEPQKGYTAQEVAAFSDDLLLKLLGSKEGVKVRSLAVGVKEAGTRGVEKFVGPLVELSSHPEFIVRVEVLKAFRKSSYRQEDVVVRSVLERLSDKEFVVRGFAARALEGVNKPAVKAALEKQLAVEKKDVVRSMIVKALGVSESKS